MWDDGDRMGGRLVGIATVLVLCGAVWSGSQPAAQTGSPQPTQPSASAPAFTGGGELMRPLDYREWAFVTSGLGMTYGPAAAADGTPMFDNVFVTPASYRHFLQTGTWPDRTMFILEIRESAANVSINNGGRTQGGVRAIEAAVKDVQRFTATGGWGYFTFDGGNGLLDRATPLPATARCYQCHSANTAVENTFVQFYPTLFDAAKAHGTVKSTYDPNRKP